MAHSCPSPIVRITDTILISNDFIIDNIHINFFRCDADPAVLGNHVLALLNKENPESELRGAMCDELDVFLQQETKGFVDQLFVTLETKSYLHLNPEHPSDNVESTTITATTEKASTGVINGQNSVIPPVATVSVQPLSFPVLYRLLRSIPEPSRGLPATVPLEINEKVAKREGVRLAT